MKKLLLTLSMLLVIACQQASAESFANFIANLGKGQQATFEGELDVTLNDTYFIFIQDSDCGLAVKAESHELKQGDRIKNPTISRANYGVVYYIKSYEKIAENVEIKPIDVTFSTLQGYSNMLVRIKDVTFNNAGYNFEENSEGIPLKQNVTANGATGIVWPWICNIIGSQIPESANVTGISYGTGENAAIRPRNLADIEATQAGDKKDMDFAMFKQKLAFMVPATFEGELIVTYVHRSNEGNCMIFYQDATAGAYYYTGSTDLQAGDIIKNVSITSMQNEDYVLNSYEIVSHNNEVTPTEIQLTDLTSGTPYSYMYVTIKNVEIEPSASGAFANESKYVIYNKYTSTRDRYLATTYCPDIVGLPIPNKADITGILFGSSQIRPLKAADVVNKGDITEIKIPDVATIEQLKASTSTDFLRYTGKAQIIYKEINEANNGFFVMQDETGGVKLRVDGFVFDGLDVNNEITNVIINNNKENALFIPTIAKVENELAEVVATNIKIEPNVIAVGSFGNTTKHYLEYTLVKYDDVTFDTADTNFIFGGLYTVKSGFKSATVYPYDALIGVEIPTNICQVIGVAEYNTELKMYTVKPRTELDILEGSKVEFNNEDAHFEVYNIAGVKVLDTDNNTMLNNLPKGLYIVNGKKVAIK